MRVNDKMITEILADEGFASRVSNLGVQRLAHDLRETREALRLLWEYLGQHHGDWWLKAEKREHALRVTDALGWPEIPRTEIPEREGR